MTASCALLVSYDGFRGGDGGDAGSDAAGRGAAIEGDAARTDAKADGAIKGCAGAVPGVYCGRALPDYQGNVQDLVRCLGDGTMGTVDACDAGCASMPAGRQDVCNVCVGRADGPYCLQELVLDYPGNDVLVGCGAGITTASSLCAKGCSSSACK